MFVCVLSPLAFMDWSAPNLAGKSGIGTENTSRDPFPWKPVCCHGNHGDFYGQIRIVVGYNIANDVTIDDVTSPVTSWITSPRQWRHGNTMTSLLVQVFSSGHLEFGDGWKCYICVSLCRWESGWEPHWQCASTL